MFRSQGVIGSRSVTLNSSRRFLVRHRADYYRPRAALPAGNDRTATLARFAEKTVGRASMAGLALQPVLLQQQVPVVESGMVLAATSALIAYGSYMTDDIEVWPPRKPFTRGVETLNGRVAMLGVIAYMLYNFQM